MFMGSRGCNPTPFSQIVGDYPLTSKFFRDCVGEELKRGL